ncbi:MAG: MgtC/SapB family protein [Gammaproteobacteria bacterium]|nr:MgtC/SapB family protein [Gammaproteobacteria bacterium]MDH5728715.1 MgtC/SapB family protein [Gammaproteobacteria bacterium]
MFEEYLPSLIRLVGALAAGGLIGLERSYNGRPAGFRTHSLVCMSSSMLMLLTVYQWELLKSAPIDTIRVDPTRMAQGLMTGIGFLGAGVIMKERFTIRGLTTAASIWVTASIGILIGMGFYVAAGIATILALGTLSLFRWFENVLPTLQFGRLSVRVLRKEHLNEDDIMEVIRYHHFGTTGRTYHLEAEGKWIRLEMTVFTRRPGAFRTLAETLAQMEEVQEFSVTPRSG